MIRHFVLALLLPFIIYARVLPVYDPDARIDDKKTGVNQDFLSAFLGNVQTSDSSIKPIIDEIKGPSNFDSGSTKGNEKPGKEEDGYDDSYGNDIYDDGYYDLSDGYADQYGYQHTDDDGQMHRHSDESQYYKASINCREFHYPHAITPTQCRDVKIRDYEPDYNRDDPNKKAFCRWDMGFSDDKDEHQGCLCPRTKYKCHKKHQCYWYKPKHSARKHGDNKDDHGQCLHNSERFYNILANLLSKRGKKDFALKIKYSSAAAKGHLPYGPSGPGYFPYDQQLYRHSHIGNGIDYGHQSDYGNSYDTPHGYGRQDSYGYGQQDGYGYGQQDGYGYGQQNGYGYGQQDGYGYDYYNNMGGYGSHNHNGGYGAHNHGGYGVHNHIGGHEAHNHGGYGVHNDIRGYGASNDIGGYGAHNDIGGYGAYNHIGSYGDYPNGVGDYGGNHPPVSNDQYSASNGQYSAGYSNVNQGYDNYGTPYGYERYGNSQPMYNAYPSQNPTQSSVTPIDVNVPYAHTQSNYIENTAYQPAREANSLSSQNVRPLPAPEYQAVPPLSEQPVYGSFPPGISSAPYQNAPNPIGSGPFGHVNINYGQKVYPPAREAHSFVSIPVKPVNAAQHQAVAPPVKVPIHQHPHPTQSYFR